MKSTELYALWATFKSAMDDAAFALDVRVAVGREMEASLPSPLLCSHSQSTLTAVKAAMTWRLDEMEKELGRTTETRKEEVSASIEEPVKGANRPRKKPVRQDATD